VESKSEYMKAEVELTPNDWATKRLGALVRHHNSGVYKKQELYGEGCNIIGVSNLYDTDHVDGQEFDRVPLSEQEQVRYTLAADDLLYGESSLVREGIARTVYVTVRGEGTAFAWHTRRYAVDVRCVLPAYLYYYLQGRAARKHMLDQCIQTAITGINTDAYFSCPVLIPSLTEQRAIASTLIDADALIISLNTLVAKKRDLKQAAMQELLTGKRRLSGFGGEWKVKPLKSVSTMNGRIGWQGLKQQEFTFREDDPFLITGMNFKDGTIRWNEVYHIPETRYEEAQPIQLHKDDILMTKDGTIGKILYVENIPYPGKASLNSHLLVFRPINNAYAPKFLFYQLNSKAFADFIDLNKSGTTFFGITQEAVGKYPAYLPKFEEQEAIAAALSDMDAEIVALEKKRDKTIALKQGMMQELLTGRVRLK
jgi:type I restriction enzyme S subunit